MRFFAYGKVMQFLYRAFNRHARYSCWCGWWGNVCSWTDTSDGSHTHIPLCPYCYTRLK
jgi:hypothetical protein